MRKLKTVLPTLAACLGLAVLSPAQAGDKGKSASSDVKKMDKKEKSAKKSRQVSGTVIRSKEVKLPGDQTSNLVVLVKTAKSDDRLVIDLGNAKFLDQENISVNTPIQAEGRLVRMGDKNLLVARQIKLGDKVIHIDRSAEMKRAQERRSQGAS